MDWIPAKPSKELFDRYWIAISEHGCCDAIGGGEYRRVLALWEENGRTVEILNFITFYANVGPGKGGCCG